MTDDLITWLRAQLDEDERLIDEYTRYMGERAAEAGSYELVLPPGWLTGEPFDRGRQRAEVEAKRRHIARYEQADALLRADPPGAIQNELHERRSAYRLVLLDDASTYAALPGYLDEWRP